LRVVQPAFKIIDDVAFALFLDMQSHMPCSVLTRRIESLFNEDAAPAIWQNVTTLSVSRDGPNLAYVCARDPLQAQA
jgi:hypothetical protein